MNESKFDKFGREVGNKLSTDEFFLKLKSFFYNGNTYRVELIDPILRKLRNLLFIFENKLNKYRFYDSSILITYDGYNTNINGYRKDSPDSLVNVHLIDFTHVKYDERVENTPDEGYIKGLKNVIEKLEGVKNDITKTNNFQH